MQNLGLYFWRQVIPPPKTINLGKPYIELNPFTFNFVTTPFTVFVKPE